jgi:1-deoxy-D-xylulose-5-phosphate synthase
VTGLLDGIDGPHDLHGLSDAELAQVAQETRELLIDTVGEVGGHFGANLGACEIAVALHSLLDSPRDKVIWDVGHQAYPHKVLTGRREQLRTIRQYGGLAPFCSIFESEHDAMGAGHASTSIGYAVGMKEAMRRGDAPDGRVVAVIGDGALTGGVAFEAIQQAGGLGTPIVVLLNDNGMSIAPNVGALSGYLNRIRVGAPPWRTREQDSFGEPGLWWEALDWAYTGVVDGHDVRALRQALRVAFRAERPVVVHCATVKGKGFAPAELGGLAGMEKWHAATSRSIAGRRPATPAPRADNAPPQYTDVFGSALLEQCRRDRRVVGVTAAMPSGTGLSILQRAMPERCFDVGIAEQQAVLFAAGLALGGSRPVVAIYSTFLQRAYDQIAHDLCLQSLPVVLCLDRAGLVGDDGPTHHGAFDIAYLRALPNITLMAPRDEAMLVHMLHTALLHDAGPVAIRYPRGQAVGVPLPATPQPIAIGTGDILREGERVALLGYGSGVHQALRAADILAERGLDVTVADARFAKPLDAGLLAQLAAEHELVVSVEEGVLMGGFGSAVLECLSESGLTPRLLRIGLPDRYVTHGKPGLLHDEIGFTPEQIAERVEAAVLDPRRPLV